MGSTPAGKASQRAVDQGRHRAITFSASYLSPLNLAILGIPVTIAMLLCCNPKIPWDAPALGLLGIAFPTLCLVLLHRQTSPRPAACRMAAGLPLGGSEIEMPNDLIATTGHQDVVSEPDGVPARFRLMESLPGVVFFYDSRCRLRWMNRTARELARTNQIDYAELPCHVAWADSAKPCDRCMMWPSSRPDSEMMAAHEFTTADGRTWSLLAYPVCDDHGRIEGILKIGRDVSEHTKLSKALERERETLERIIDQNPSSIALFTPDGRFIRGNPAFLNLFEIADLAEAEPLINEYCLFDDPILLENGLRDELERVRAGQVVDIPAVRYNASRIVPGAPDRTVFISGRASPILDADGAVDSILVTHEDLTRRDQIEQELQVSQERLALALDPAIEGLWDFDIAKGKVNYFSPRWFSMLGWEPRELPHRFEAWLQLLHPEDRVWLEPLAGAMLTEGSEEAVEYRMAHKEGGYRWVASRGRVVSRDAHGKPLRMIGTHVDITGRKEAEARIRELQAQLAHASRLSTMGELAAGFAHELNQPLTAIASYARAAVRNIEAKRISTDDISAILKKISEQAERAGHVIRSLRGYIRPTTAPIQSSQHADVNECAREAVLLLRYEARQNSVRIGLSLGTDLSDVSIGRIELVQVFVNLVLNSIEALASTERGDRALDIETTTADQGNIMVRVADNGPGLSRAAAEQVFEPFFTTKPNGMGVGLAICRRILEAHGGSLSVASSDSGGAVFTFSLCQAHGRNTNGS